MRDPRRRWPRHALVAGIVLGVVLSFAIVGGVQPVVHLIPATSGVTLPGATTDPCADPPSTNDTCTTPGMVPFGFTVQGPFRLVGTLVSGSPFGHVVMPVGGIFPCGYLARGPISCPTIASTVPVTALYPASATADLATLPIAQTCHTGSVCTGDWTLFLVNPGDAPLVVHATAPVEVESSA